MTDAPDLYSWRPPVKASSEEREILEDYRELALAAQRIFFPDKNVCVGAVRLAKATLEPLGFTVKAVPCSMVVECEELQMAYLTGFSKEGKDRMKTTNTWIDLKTDEEGWDGHVIAEINGHYILDPTISQARVIGIDFHDMILLDTGGELEPLVKDKGIDMLMTVDNNGDQKDLRVRYVATEDFTFLESDAWNDEAIIEPIATGIRTGLKMRRELARSRATN